MSKFYQPDHEDAAELVRRQLNMLFQTLAGTHPWLRGRLDDAVNEVMLLLHQRHGPDIWEQFNHRNFGSPESDKAKPLIFQAIGSVLDRMRNRRRVEIRPGTPNYDPEAAAAGRRQRRTVEPDLPLGEKSRLLTNREDQNRSRLDVKLDVASALSDLDVETRSVIDRRFVQGETWDEIAEALHISVRQARSRFADALCKLHILLHTYKEDF